MKTNAHKINSFSEKQNTDEISFKRYKLLLSKFPILNELSDYDVKAFSKIGMIQKFPANKVMYKVGDPCHFFALINSGIVRVYRENENGSQITLYKVGEGECCFLTASCVMQDTEFPAVAISEKELEVVMLPSNILQDWVAKNPLWRRYVFKLLASRLSNIAEKVDDLAFQSIERRLAELLLKSQINGAVKMTHQAMALDLGTAREVVSRNLKDLEIAGIIKLSRGKTLILDPVSLENIIKK